MEDVKEQYFEVNKRQKIAVEKKKIRRAIFKADQWYENAAMSIGIAGRPKGARQGVALIPRVKDRAD